LALQNVQPSRTVLAMNTLNEPIAKRIGKLVRMFGSDNEHERGNALERLVVVLKEEKISFNDLATVIENANGEIEAKKYSDTDAEIIFAKGVEKGRAERPRQEPTEFFDTNNQPQWHVIALYCQRHYERLEQKHREFIDDMAGNTVWRAPTEKQGKYLLSLFYRLGRGKLQ
jgi:hypothetical protein